MRAPRIGLAVTAAAAMTTGAALSFAAEPGPDTLPISVIAIQTDAADDQAEALTKALRNAVRGIPGWSLGEGDFSLEVLTLSLKCSEPPDASCQSRIADQIKSDRYVWGTIQKKAKDVHGTLNFWVRGKGTSKVPVEYTANLTESTDETLKLIAAQAITDLTGGPPKGDVHIKAGDLQGQVFIDGQPVGALKSGGGTFLVSSGPHKITVKAPGYVDSESQVVVKPTGAPTEVTVVPIKNEPATPVNWRKVGGFASVGVGVVAGIVGLASSLKVNSVQNDPRYAKLRNDYYSAKDNPSDVCATATTAKDMSPIVADCNSAKTAQTLQIVMYPIAAVAAGLGVYLIATSSSAPKPAATGFKIDPQVGFNSGKLDVTYTW